jgi:hypothetical protein
MIAKPFNPKHAKAPSHLSPESSALWDRLVVDYDLTGDDAALAVLQSALEAKDRADAARVILDREGLTIPGDRGGRKAHPCCAIERDARSAFLQAMRFLKLEAAPPPIKGRR